MSTEPIPEAARRYTGVAIALHWIIALGIIGMIAGGWYMTGLPDDHPNQYALYQLHKSIGITILLLTIARIIWRLMNPPPPEPSNLAGWEKACAHAAHIAFYGLMILLPLTGWFYASVSTNLQVPTVLYGAVSWPHVPFAEQMQVDAISNAANTAHGALAWVAIALLVLHVAGAVKHELEPGEGVLKRMMPGLVGATSKPAPSKGFIAAFGSALAVFAVVAAVPMMQSAASPQLDRDGSAATGSAAWTVDYEQSEVRFAFSHDGDDFDGVFEDWTASIVFDPSDPASADVSGEFSTATAVTGVKTYDDSLKASEWFNVRAFPTAVVTIDGFEPGAAEGDWTAQATLTLKEASVTVPFAFSLEIDGDIANMTGGTTLQRQPLDLGQDSDPGADYVSEDVVVTVTIVANRAE